MTYAQFLAALRKTPRKWVFQNRMIRCKRGRSGNKVTCPITEVEPKHSSPKDWRSAADNSNLRRETAKRIVTAADASFWAKPQIRRDLLKACGLKEKA